MSLPVLVIIVTLGIAAIVAAVHFSGGSARRVFASKDEAAELFAIDHPDEIVRETWLTKDRSDAFLALSDGRVGIAHAVGAKALTRIPVARDIVSVELGHNGMLSILFRDFTWPGGTFEFDSIDDARSVLERLPLETTDDNDG
ncbi:MAG: hypothetical protein K5872_23120 [Rhizobiaceae bacterium]|nr:hypothetical protein [Rhizobiaceae bacterium]MCV0409112.1 hypothetical protein [Rhizobiaceae bacterium]